MSEAPKVVSLRGGEILPPGEPKPNVVKFCEELLERAKSGELAGLYAVLHHSDEAHSYQIVGPIGYATIGAAEVLKAVMVRDVAGG